MGRLTMSLERTLRTLTILVIGCVAMPAFARTSFSPFLSLSYGYTDNVSYVDDNGADASDSTGQAGAGFSLTRDIQNGSLQLTASTRYTMYDEFDQLDNGSHSLTLDFGQSRGRGTFGLNTRYSRTQDQGRVDDLEEADVEISRRTTRERYGFGGNYSYDTANGNWTWNSSASVSSAEYDDISGVPGGSPIVDRTSYRAGVGFSKLLNRRTSVGADYSYQLFDLDGGVDETVNGVAFTLGHEWSRQVTLGFSLGAFHRSQDAPMGQSDDLDQDDIFGGVSFIREFQSASFSANLTRGASSGGAHSGTSTNTALGVALGGSVTGSRWGWRVAARAANRDPSVSSEEDTDTLSLGGSLSRRIGRVLSLAMDANWVEQSSDDPSRDNDGYYQASIGLIWRPLGNLPISGGGR
jgi:hypothetical protein